MNLKSAFIILVTLFSFSIVYGQGSPTLPIYNSKSFTDNTLTIYSDSGALALTAIKANVVKIVFFDLGKPIVEPKSQMKLNVRVTQNLDDIFFATDSLWVIVNKIDLSIRFLKKVNEQLFIKNESYFINNQSRDISLSLNADDKPFVLDAGKLKSVGKKIGAVKNLNGKNKLCDPVLFSQMGCALVIENPTSKKITAEAITKSEVQFKQNDKKLNVFYFLSGSTNQIKSYINLIRN